jgi:hypothetical protein
MVSKLEIAEVVELSDALEPVSQSLLRFLDAVDHLGNLAFAGLLLRLLDFLELALSIMLVSKSVSLLTVWRRLVGIVLVFRAIQATAS